MRAFLVALALPVLVACTHTSPTPPMESKAATSIISGPTGDKIGDVSFVQGPRGLLIEIVLSQGALPPGWHGVHFHQVGDCSDIGVYKASGGHVGLIVDGHGLLNPIGPEDGDLPNINVHEDGSAAAEMYTELTTLNALVDEDGSALVIHAERDDHISQPIGGAGPRIACAVVGG